ncbi:MAG: YARHG domain-containing protein [Treponema sp.]|nr:YARHG domain-containing protein [Treponema sp.]
MKRTLILILILVFCISNSLFSFESTQTDDKFLEKFRNSYYDDFEKTWFYKIDKDYNLLLVDHYEAFIVNSENCFKKSKLYLWTDEDCGQKLSSQIEKYRLKPFYVYVIDLSFDEKYDILDYSLGGMCLDFEMYTDTEDRDYLFDYSRSLYTFEGIEIKFCIINGKRGFIFTEPQKYENNKSGFYYWSTSEQKYILDESATQEQIKKAIAPEDYFAYNGLKFSSLNKKLKKSDLENLDAAQLRLMRNAIYARHGRVFTSVDLQSLWECYTWYKPNPDYNDSMLTKTDKKNLKLIQDMEKVTGTYVPDLPK